MAPDRPILYTITLDHALAHSRSCYRAHELRTSQAELAKGIAFLLLGAVTFAAIVFALVVFARRDLAALTNTRHLRLDP
jgi:hypothetical protein